MKTVLTVVTPRLARDFLAKNSPGNRPMRPSLVNDLLSAFKRGEYILTHQGIAFDEDGFLVDGQHRLSAIAMLPEGVSLPMNVSSGVARQGFQVMDCGAKRSAADLLRLDRSLVEPGIFVARILSGAGAVTPQLAAPYIEAMQAAVEELQQHCPTRRRVWSAAPVRAAAAVQILRGIDPGYVLGTYRLLVSGDVKAMNNITLAFWQADHSGRLNSTDRVDLYARALKVFDPGNAKLTRVQISGVQFALDMTRAYFQAAGLLPTARPSHARRQRTNAAGVSLHEGRQ